MTAAAAARRGEEFVEAKAAGERPAWLERARPVLDAAGRLHVAPAGWDGDAMYPRFVDDLRRLEADFTGAGATASEARTAHYVVCAAVDDLVLNARAGAPESWARNSLISIFHRDAIGGDKVFDILERGIGDPVSNRSLLELIYAALALGFLGRLRLNPNHVEESARLREDVYKALRRSAPGELSPHWRGVAAPAVKPALPGSVIAAAFGALAIVAAAGYGLAWWVTKTRADSVIQAYQAAPPQPPPSLKLQVLTITQKLQGFLAPEIKAGLVTVTDDPLGTLVRIRNQGMFGIGAADVDPRYAPLVDKIGQSVARENAGLLVVGHTDNQPINTPAFPSNDALSLARAQSVATLLGKRVPPERIKSEGRGASQPLANNDTELGRDANRRTDIYVLWSRGNASK